MTMAGRVDGRRVATEERRMSGEGEGGDWVVSSFHPISCTGRGRESPKGGAAGMIMVGRFLNISQANSKCVRVEREKGVRGKGGRNVLFCRG